MSDKVRADLVLLLVATLWGFAFVAQRLGMESLGAFSFNGLRFLLGAVSLLPLLLWFKPSHQHDFSQLLKSGILAGTVLFGGASLQQVGLIYTTAGNAGFITGLYIILVPLLGIFIGQFISINTWLAGGLAVVGLYLLSVHELNGVNIGDILELLGAFCWAAHVLIIGKLAPKLDSLRLAVVQFVVCGLLSFIVALVFEADSLTWQNTKSSWLPIAYAGLISVGIAYTLQIIAQKHAPPAHAAVIMSMETVMAALGGWLLLNEELSAVEFIGCLLMFVAMLVSQLPFLTKKVKLS